VLGNLASATTSLAQFTSLLTSSNISLPTQSIDSAKSSVRIFPSIPLLNFLALLLLAAQKNDAGLFRQLAKHYAGHLKEVEEFWGEALANVGEIWFNIRIPNKNAGNPLFDMMSNMMFGGGGGAQGRQQGNTPRSGTPKPALGQGKPAAGGGPAPTAMDLD
jgi:golgi to ER traffic protein 4